MVDWGVVNLKRPRGGQFGPAKGGHFERRIQFMHRMVIMEKLTNIFLQKQPLNIY
jgi:hypothetical protein